MLRHKDNDATPEALIVYATADRVFFRNIRLYLMRVHFHFHFHFSVSSALEIGPHPLLVEGAGKLLR